MYEIREVVQLTYHIAAETEKNAIKMWQDLVDRPSRKLLSMECNEVKHPSIQNQSHKSGRPLLKVVRPTIEGEDDGPVPSAS